MSMAVVNPFREPDRLLTVPGTRMLQDSFGLVGCSFEDPMMPERSWIIDGVYAPIPGRALGGIRVRVTDQKGFISFCNQRDLEILLGLAKSGDYCPWTDSAYPYVNDPEDGWIGLLADRMDLADDLHERELVMRVQHNWGVLPGMDLTRLIHRSENKDTQRLDILIWDADPDTGLGPDPSLANVSKRWRFVEEQEVRWQQL
jgi:hypothetical protein